VHHRFEIKPNLLVNSETTGKVIRRFLKVWILLQIPAAVLQILIKGNVNDKLKTISSNTINHDDTLRN
jgi:hypothetical protein